jgi:DnaJ-class molecular chaperone
VSGQQTGSVGVYKETAEISAVSNRSISDHEICSECEGEGVLYGMYTRNNRNVMYAEWCDKCGGRQDRPRSYPNLKVRS